MLSSFSVADSPFYFGFNKRCFSDAVFVMLSSFPSTIHTYTFTHVHVRYRLKKLRVDDLLKHTRDQKPDLATEIKR